VIYGQYFDHFVWFYSGSLFTYGAFALIVVLGMFTLKKVRVPNLAVSALGASVIFFIVSNFGVWLTSGMYPPTFSGLMTCYTAGIPFFHNTILGDLVYTGVLFGAFELCVRKIPQLRAAPIQ
jgi:formate-dependent nitrite reductase membrane component NrfD